MPGEKFVRSDDKGEFHFTPTWRQRGTLKVCGGIISVTIHLKKIQLDAQFIFNIFRQTPLHVSDVSIAHNQEVHRMDKTVGTYCSVWCTGWVGTGLEPSQDTRQSSKKNNKYGLLYTCGLPTDDGL